MIWLIDWFQMSQTKEKIIPKVRADDEEEEAHHEQGQKRDSALEKMKEYLNRDEELEEEGETYAGLMWWGVWKGLVMRLCGRELEVLEAIFPLARSNSY